MEGLKLSEADQLSIKVKAEYGMDIKKINSLKDGSFLLTAYDGMLNLKRINESETYVINMTGLYEYLTERGFLNILKIYKTKSGRYYMHHSDGIYIVSEYVEDAPISFSFDGIEEDMIELLTHFHKASLLYVSPSGGKLKSCWGRWIEEYKRYLKNLKSYVGQVRLSGSLAPSDIMFTTSCDLYIERIVKSIEILRKKGYIDIVEANMKKRLVCIGGFKQSNFFKTKQGIFIRSLNKCKYDIPEWDITELTQKFMECKADLPIGKLCSLVYKYNQVNTLPYNSIDIIKAMLLFPEQYVNICIKRCKNRDKWPEGEYMERLKNAMLMDDRKMQLSEALEPIKP